MIVILYQDRCPGCRRQDRLELIGAFGDQVLIVPIAADSAGGWPADISWNDLLIVFYNGLGIPPWRERISCDYLQKRPEIGLLLPVAVNSAAPKPPQAAAAIKALPYDAAAPGPKGRLVTRVGGMLGLRLHGKEIAGFSSPIARPMVPPSRNSCTNI